MGTGTWNADSRSLSEEKVINYSKTNGKNNRALFVRALISPTIHTYLLPMVLAGVCMWASCLKSCMITQNQVHLVQERICMRVFFPACLNAHSVHFQSADMCTNTFKLTLIMTCFEPAFPHDGLISHSKASRTCRGAFQCSTSSTFLNIPLHYNAATPQT